MRKIRTVTAGLILAVGLSGAGVGLAGAASAAPPSPAPPAPVPVRVFRTWPAAQRAAGFRLVRPARTDGLKRRGGIDVARCQPARLRRGRRDRQVSVTYRSRHPAVPLGRMITLSQANAPRVPCPAFVLAPAGKVVGRVRVDGATAILTRARIGWCVGKPGGRRTCSFAVIRGLSWARHRHFYRVVGVRVGRAQLVAFARGLTAVK
jgi:hypothetical protein